MVRNRKLKFDDAVDLSNERFSTLSGMGDGLEGVEEARPPSTLVVPDLFSPNQFTLVLHFQLFSHN